MLLRIAAIEGKEKRTDKFVVGPFLLAKNP